MQQYGTFRTIELFSQRHGLDAVFQFQQLCNQGASLRRISETFGESIPTVCRLEKLFFKRVYVFENHIKEFLDFRIAIDQSTIQQRKEMIKKNAPESMLHFIPGDHCGSDSI